MQDWPLEEKTPNITPARACSMSASASTMVGDLPPSSSETGMIFSAAACAIVRPVSVPPVKLTFPVRGWRTMASPTMLPRPGSTDRSPAGSESSSRARLISRPSASETSGVHSAGFSRTALPPARAGASFCASLATGEFQGLIAPMTPIGSKVLIVR